MDRKEVYKIIDDERDYQESLNNSYSGCAKTVGDYVTMLQHYQQVLVTAWTVNPGTDAALEVMRKVAGIAVHCMEDHGAPYRSDMCDIDGCDNKATIIISGAFHSNKRCGTCATNVTYTTHIGDR